MAKLIFTSRYIRDAPPEHLQNYVRYISTREGVEKVDESKKNLSASQSQKNLIRQILKDMPESKEMLEYEDYRQHPTIGNASEFITQALERNLDMAAMKENYVDYLANRPRVERIGEHGLFTDAGKPVVLAQVQREASDHKGPIWTHVVSLRREDATRLGYDSAGQWMALLRSKRAMLCKYMKIDSADLRWYAAFHNEGHHPHVHLMVYSAKDNDGYLTKAGIEAMRSELAHAIFRQDFAQIYEGQTQARAELKEKATERMRLLTDRMMEGVCDSPVIGEKLQMLSGRLKNTSGKKVYGYLKADVKKLVDQIVDELAKEPRVGEAYQAWGEWRDQILKTYSSKTLPLPPLSKQKELKSIKNMVIAEALKLGGHHFFRKCLTRKVIFRNQVWMTGKKKEIRVNWKRMTFHWIRTGKERKFFRMPMESRKTKSFCQRWNLPAKKEGKRRERQNGAGGTNRPGTICTEAKRQNRISGKP